MCPHTKTRIPRVSLSINIGKYSIPHFPTDGTFRMVPVVEGNDSPKTLLFQIRYYSFMSQLRKTTTKKANKIIGGA